jgi:hypothetical protein
MAEIVRLRSPFRLPGPRDRLAIIGRTGSGKTHFASWVLSHANWPTHPWIVVDYKKDDILAGLPAEEIRVDERRLPRHGGLYVVHPGPQDAEKIDGLLWKIWRQGHTGLYVDEGHILPDSESLQAILTQGRSKSIPAIILTQRPKWVNRFVFSEADAYSVFHLNDRRDQLTVQEFTPIDMKKIKLEPHHSFYYRIADNQLFRMNPVPGRADILQTFNDRNPARTKARMI